MTGDAPFRIYVLRDGEPCCVASCEEDALGFALRNLKDENQIEDGDCVGILERPDERERGRWLVNPWATTTPFGTVREPTVDDLRRYWGSR